MTRSMIATELKAKILSVLDDVANAEVVEVFERARRYSARAGPGDRSLGPGASRVAATAVQDEDVLFSTGESGAIE